MLVKSGSINVCFKLYAEESYSLADSKEGSRGPGIRIPPSTFSFLLPPVPKYLSEIKIIPTLR